MTPQDFGMLVIDLLLFGLIVFIARANDNDDDDDIDGGCPA